jgi:hypothetical protein
MRSLGLGTKSQTWWTTKDSRHPGKASSCHLKIPKLNTFPILIIITMAKTDVFDRSPPLVAATPADAYNPDDPVVNAVPVEPLQLDGVPMMPLEDEDERELQQNKMVGAGVIGGIVGLLVGGPLFGIIAGFYAAYSTKQEGAAGDVARAMGEVALEAKQKAQDIDEKHHLMEKGKQMANDAWEKAKQIDREHGVVEKTGKFLLWSLRAMEKQNQKHRFLERIMNATGVFLAFVFTKIQQAITSAEQEQERQRQQQQQQQNLNPPPTNPEHRQ